MAAQAKEIADGLEAPLSSVYVELRRGQDGSRMQNQRLRDNADIAQKRRCLLNGVGTELGTAWELEREPGMPEGYFGDVVQGLTTTKKRN